MIARFWHGWTTRDDADAYEDLLRTEIFPGIASKGVEGYRGIRLFRRISGEDEVEFVTVMHFDSLGAVREFAGTEYERAYVPTAARDLLVRWDEVATHYEVREVRDHPGEG